MKLSLCSVENCSTREDIWTPPPSLMDSCLCCVSRAVCVWLLLSWCCSVVLNMLASVAVLVAKKTFLKALLLDLFGVILTWLLLCVVPKESVFSSCRLHPPDEEWSMAYRTYPTELGCASSFFCKRSRKVNEKVFFPQKKKKRKKKWLIFMNGAGSGWENKKRMHNFVKLIHSHWAR